MLALRCADDRRDVRAGSKVVAQTGATLKQLLTATTIGRTNHFLVLTVLSSASRSLALCLRSHKSGLAYGLPD